ncbi:hypothetical protein [Lapillicoccus jejuensis]|nr:hypothetical protein [Lapillicoccus jejuensis]
MCLLLRSGGGSPYGVLRVVLRGWLPVSRDAATGRAVSARPVA